MRAIPLATAFVLTLVAPWAQAAGEVQLHIKPAEHLSDVGRGLDRSRNLKALREQFQALAARLGAGQVLKLEVLDVDMAGEVQPVHQGDELRVLKGAADWPKLELRWSLTRGPQTLASGHERLADMNYLAEPLRSNQDNPIPYEARMIRRWFDQHVAGASAPSAR